MKITLVSPYHGGSHQAWAEGYRQYSRHDISLLTLPDRFWKWRMHGGAVTLARRFQAGGRRPDLILATDMLDLSTFLALTRRLTNRTPVALYMHENQLTYPLPADGATGPMRRQSGERDLHYAFINYASMMTADQILFNSQYHHDSLFAALPNFLKHFPEYNELDTVVTLQRKSQVLAVGVDFERLKIRDRGLGIGDRPMPSPIPDPRSPIPDPQSPLIIWNQRWEYDKNPAAFFKALYRLADAGVPFRLALCGRQFGKRPPIFDEARHRLSDQLIHVGYVDIERYRELLWEAAVTISTAHHEFFGISILEAIYCHTFPLLPARLSYPELIPESLHSLCLYQSEVELDQQLYWALTHLAEIATMTPKLAVAGQRFHWSQLGPHYDEAFQLIVDSA